MCGRFTLVRLSDFLDRFPWITPPENAIEPRYNVSPSQFVPVARASDKGGPGTEMMKWGFVPFWTKGKPKLAPINAKSETLATGRMFRQAFDRRRCLVPTDGFYEWKGAKPPKQPYYIHRRDGQPFAFAGLWERREPEDADAVDTFTILTTSPNKLMAEIHNRMPVILAEKEYDRWVDARKPGADVADLLKPFPVKELEAFTVNTQVNNVRNQGAELIERLR
jgi:putative SOS response-associated peptidase YedK